MTLFCYTSSSISSISATFPKICTMFIHCAAPCYCHCKISNEKMWDPQILGWKKKSSKGEHLRIDFQRDKDLGKTFFFFYQLFHMRLKTNHLTNNSELFFSPDTDTRLDSNDVLLISGHRTQTVLEKLTVAVCVRKNMKIFIHSIFLRLREHVSLLLGEAALKHEKVSERIRK